MSGSPSDQKHDARLYVTQILLVLASSPLHWTGTDAFHLVGYSFGGGLAVAFARYFSASLKSLTLIAPCGLVREDHINWKHKLLYSVGLLPERLIQYLVKRRMSAVSVVPPTSIIDTRTNMRAPAPKAIDVKKGDSDITGGVSYDHAPLSKRLPGVTVATSVAQQIGCHQGFIDAFISSIRYAPIYDQKGLWSATARSLRTKEQGAGEMLRGNRILFILGATDSVIRAKELEPDARAVLGDDMVEFVIMDAGHELVMTASEEIVTAVLDFWRS